MKIGLFTDTYVPDTNGVVTVIRLMERELTRAGHRVYVFAPAYPGHAEVRADVHRFPSVRMVLYEGMRIALPVVSRSVLRRISSLDIVHSHDPFSVGQVAFWAARWYKIPHVHTYHTLYMEYRRYLPRPLRPPPRTVEHLSRTFCNRCDTIVAPSRPMEKELRTYGVTVPIYPLPFGVDEEDFAHPIEWNMRQESGLVTNDLLLFAGRLGWEKNVDFLLRAFRQLLPERPHARLVIAGGGPHHKNLEQLAADLGVADKVTFTGQLPRERLIDLYKQATLFVFASKTETQGLVLVEAMMAGLPPVALGRMGALDVVTHGETGLLVEEDESEFAAACLRLLANEGERRRLGEAARAWAVSQSARSSTAKLIRIYEEVAARRVSSPPRS
ncbi:TPA: glycosyltransferase family 4 protein [Candidatus Acetothermia bacterium]|nr:glycosyltransferase family 4 protein [Candidatus Acetothermia bacterium]